MEDLRKVRYVQSFIHNIIRLLPCSPNIANIIRPDMLIIDGGRAEYTMLLRRLAIAKTLLVGDGNQLQPVVGGPTPSKVIKLTYILERALREIRHY